MMRGIKGDKRLTGAEKRGINKMVRKKKVQNKAADWKSRLLGWGWGWAKTENHH